LVNTYAVTAWNARAIICFVAMLTQFIDPLADMTLQLWLLAITFVMLATVNATGYARFAAPALRLLVCAKTRRLFSLGGGTRLSAAGQTALTTPLIAVSKNRASCFGLKPCTKCMATLTLLRQWLFILIRPWLWRYTAGGQVFFWCAATDDALHYSHSHKRLSAFVILSGVVRRILPQAMG
jgi:hypothetical protein